MKDYHQARADKYMSIVERVRNAKPYRLGMIARSLDMSELELSSFISQRGCYGLPLLTDLIEIEKKLNEVLK
jgi:hypothetical protein